MPVALEFVRRSPPTIVGSLVNDETPPMGRRRSTILHEIDRCATPACAAPAAQIAGIRRLNPHLRLCNESCKMRSDQSFTLTPQAVLHHRFRSNRLLSKMDARRNRGSVPNRNWRPGTA